MPDIEITFDPPADFDELPAEVIARIDRLAEDLAALGPDWLLQVIWGDLRDGTNQLTATPATNQTGATE